jgi:hypothetical protein
MLKYKTMGNALCTVEILPKESFGYGKDRKKRKKRSAVQGDHAAAG